jgi:hypothetical protein
MHFSTLMAGIFFELSSPLTELIIWIAPVGQWRAQLSQLSPLEIGIQFFLIHTACPIWVELFSALSIGLIAPVGQTSPHLVHSGLQYPLSKERVGCISVERSVEGRSTSLGHAETQSWHAVQLWDILHADCEPGGVMAVSRSGACFSSMAANPPSTFFFSCAKARELVANATPVKKERREASGALSS